ncbi:carbohydrate-binding domain-containing protein [Teredinibacter franksiae]|uniref:carbohydrate-binding domain-containing protein n=1 Tax=Teredinibacter franksiae TaxID=2761453 RepID=UPI001626AB9A|nr:carbohydrate-binding domain-containing protein [Teredinibacter franksiae]
MKITKFKKISSVAIMAFSVFFCANLLAQDYPTCSSSSADPDGDGWGWENNQSCIVASSGSGAYPTCSSASSDPDADGWGWENNQSCVVDTCNSGSSSDGASNYPTCGSASSDPDGDGWGWENKPVVEPVHLTAAEAVVRAVVLLPCRAQVE